MREIERECVSIEREKKNDREREIYKGDFQHLGTMASATCRNLVGGQKYV